MISTKATVRASNDMPPACAMNYCDVTMYSDQPEAKYARPCRYSLRGLDM
jgi:hypothetical protein